MGYAIITEVFRFVGELLTRRMHIAITKISPIFKKGMAQTVKTSEAYKMLMMRIKIG